MRLESVLHLALNVSFLDERCRKKFPGKVSVGKLLVPRSALNANKRIRKKFIVFKIVFEGRCTVTYDIVYWTKSLQCLRLLGGVRRKLKTTQRRIIVAVRKEDEDALHPMFQATTRTKMLPTGWRWMERQKVWISLQESLCDMP